MGEVVRQVETSTAFLEFVRSKVHTCFLCKWIDTDIALHKKLTGWPLDSFNKPEFPVDAKLNHVILELGDSAPEGFEDDDDLASMILHLMETQELRKD